MCVWLVVGDLMKPASFERASGEIRSAIRLGVAATQFDY